MDQVGAVSDRQRLRSADQYSRHRLVEDDLKRGVSGAVPIPPDDAGKEEVINSLVANVEAMIKADRKITSLKQLQGHIWRTRFQNKELQRVVYDDVPEALRRWHANGIKFTESELFML
ncbi:putative bifunctional methylthioribulose-1-phosphate dehydratase/enolase-phosphatase E1 [Ananas comosus]|uniref:Putative bifunctional methylthioribulose-1-phosphate dehydratase/enolase-phosphatase E1 n=1 Tax=Ananas comosus TaxID=4615 RepID=A0A199VAF4_ANACO|nr:putative bifunctional methylthioribulose-1-phosphate dehydratase/enolase-phosphatase E1 [Ananas comosus]